MSSEHQEPKSNNTYVDGSTAMGQEHISTSTTDTEEAMFGGSQIQAAAMKALAVNAGVIEPCPIDVTLPKFAAQTAGSKVTKCINELAAQRFVEFMAGQNLKSIDMSDVTSPHVSDWLAADGAKYNLGIGTIRRYKQALGVMFETAFEMGLIPTNVVRHVKLPQQPKFSCRPPLTDPELVQTFLAGDEEWQDMTITGSVTGMHLPEVSLTVVGEIDFVTGFLRPLTRKTGQIEPQPLPGWLLERWEQKYQGLPPNTPLFPRAYKWTCVNVQMTSSRVASEFKQLLIRAGVRRPAEAAQGIKVAVGRKHSALTFGSLRHYFIEQLRNSNVSEAMARQFVGNKSEAVFPTYQCFGEKAAKAVVDQLHNPLKDLVNTVAKQRIPENPGLVKDPEKKAGQQN
jgi:hypothetical protein